MSVFTQVSLFILSFLPLWISVIFIDIKSIYFNSANLITEISSIVVIIICLPLSALIVYKAVSTKNKRHGDIYFVKNVKEEKKITSEFLLSYVLPLCTFDFTLWSDVVLFLIFFVTLLFLFIKHDYFCVNISLELFNISLYSCVLIKNENCAEFPIHKMILSKYNLIGHENDSIKIAPLNNECSLLLQVIEEE